MCRFLIYFNPNKDPVYLKNIIYDFDHSIIKQSHIECYTPGLENNTLNADLNADGFGIGWVNCYDKNFYKYKNTQPIWNDENLFSITNNIKSNIILAHIRANLFGLFAPVSLFNSHPFVINNFMWMHNGCVCNFLNKKANFTNLIDPTINKKIKGSTDSEYCFGLFLTFYYQLNNPIHAMIKLINFIKKIELKAYLNFVVCNNDFMIVTRSAINNDREPLSLYHNKKLQIVSSEPLEKDNDEWKIIPNNNLIYMDKENNYKIESIF